MSKPMLQMKPMNAILHTAAMSQLQLIRLSQHVPWWNRKMMCTAERPTPREDRLVRCSACRSCVLRAKRFSASRHVCKPVSLFLVERVPCLCGGGSVSLLYLFVVADTCQRKGGHHGYPVSLSQSSQKRRAAC